MNLVENSYKKYLETQQGTNHYMLVKAYCDMMISFEDIETILGDECRLNKTACCAEDYAFAVKKYLNGDDDDN
jgi:hypothetical protein